ncbi:MULTISPECIES: SDR family oxidoreductase [unclassified Streptomyces]|uniref:SDR family oxidoreductase n=1 Tax=unclassified Streptomyces TaxID=2593676 RepID=UPI0006B00371|nr:MULTISPECIES: SDR family oxidoreductase [unclassified Streptomyces]KOX30819.1 short-chain dehydrogenase [Streptomyces sp. NRRL F-6491]KOX38853.1 short-chain dehydrogenase [Streptomyces sp. NRRL F-6492]
MSSTALTGRTALVTGASRGIGRAIALRLAADGARVAVHYASNEAAAKETVDTIEAAGGSAFAIRTELGVPGDAEALWEAFDAHADGVDILVNNAGIAGPGTIHEVEEADYDRVFAVNAKAPFFIVKHGLERLRDGGRIVNVSSGVTKVAFPGMTSYAASKGAVEVLTLTLAETLGSRGITVNAVSPGTIETDIHPWMADPAAKAHAAGFSVFNRVGQPADVADVVGFLASSDGRWVTGQNIDVSGGSGLGL